jgi:ABC transport system ATP-binding/permease protein
MSEIICNIKNLSLSFGEKTIFKSADFVISTGEKIGLLGLNGKGKSCLMNLLDNKVAPDITDPPCEFVKSNTIFNVLHIPQELPLPEKSILAEDYFYYFFKEYHELKTELDRVTKEINTSQDPKKQQALISKQKDIMEKFEHQEIWEHQKQYNSYLKFFNLINIDSPVQMFSGGEKRKVLLALGLSSKKDLILWDEPTNHLDLETITKLEQELLNCNNAFIIISHDRYLLSKVTNKILQIKNTKIETFNGSYTDYLEYLSQEEEARKRLLGRLKNRLRREQDWMNQGIKARGTRSKKRVDGYVELKQKVSTIKDQAKKSLDFNLESSQRKTKVLAQVIKGSFKYESSQDPQFINLDLSVQNKNKIGILGPNGSGKTTLINIFTDKLKLSSGKIKRADELVIGHFKQTRDELPPNDTPYDYLGEGTDSVNLISGRKMHVAGYIKKFMFTGEDLYRPLKTFSGGERNRIQLAKNLLTPADIWIFDEPTNDLDLETIQVLENELSSYKGAVIIVSHDRAFLSAVTNKIWAINNKSIEQFNGGYAQAEQYLDILELEKQLIREDNKNKENSSNITKNTTQEKASNKDKKRLSEIEKNISTNEAKVEVLQQKISTFDFNQINEEQAIFYKKISEKIEQLEEELLSLYEEQEDLKKLNF